MAITGWITDDGQQRLITRDGGDGSRTREMDGNGSRTTEMAAMDDGKMARDDGKQKAQRQGVKKKKSHCQEERPLSR